MSEGDLVRVYECLCDVTRLRILHLLMKSALCVCHLEQIVGGPQARISRHLAYLKRHGVVTTLRHHNWSIYQLQKSHSELVELQLRCLQDCVQEMSVFREDRERLATLRDDVKWIENLMAGRLFSVPPKGSDCR
ncbi:MAG: metalloregulator ArsR/SmtB family transcription factor [Chthoniobacterales bacterium]